MNTKMNQYNKNKCGQDEHKINNRTKQRKKKDREKNHTHTHRQIQKETEKKATGKTK